MVSPQVSRPLKSRAMGMISGVATNLKTRLAQFNVSPGSSSSVEVPRRTSPTDSKRSSLGEQPASVIPLTVPGADTTSSMSSFPYGNFPLF